MTDKPATDKPVTDKPAQQRSITDAAALKALAHPIRIKLLEELGDRGHATATELALALDESSGSTSYHLRQLHRHGFIEDAPGLGSGRERVWRSVPGGWNLPVLDLMDEDASQLAATAILRSHLQADVDRTLRAIEESAAWPEPWREAMVRLETHLQLTAEQAAALNNELEEVTNRYRAMPLEPGARRVVVTLVTTPTSHDAIAPAPETEAP